jgi:hypothetical protein
MSSTITLIIEGPLPSLEIQNRISKYKFYKSFLFGLRGWVNGKIMLIDPDRNVGVTNKFGKNDLKKFLLN